MMSTVKEQKNQTNSKMNGLLNDVSMDENEFEELFIGSDFNFKKGVKYTSVRKELTIEDVKQDKGLGYKYIMQEWMKGVNIKSINNYIPGKMYFFAMMGAKFKLCTIQKMGGVTDLRVPIIWFQPSGSGKSQMNKYGLDVARKVGVSAVIETSFTEAGLIGTYDKAKNEFNIRHNLSKSDSIVKLESHGGNERNSPKVFKDPVIKGDMSNFDLIFIDEGKILIQPNRYTEQVLSVIQPALDFPGSVRKKMAADTPIEYDCSTTLVTTTVEIKDLNSDILDQGFFQRGLFYVKNVTADEYRDVFNKALLFDENNYKEVLLNITTFLNGEYKELPKFETEIYYAVTEEGNAHIKNKMNLWFDRIKKHLVGGQLTRAQSFISRFNMFIFKIAGVIAHLNRRPFSGKIDGNKKIHYATADDVKESIMFMDIMFENMMENIGISCLNLYKEEKGEDSELKVVANIIKQLVKESKVNNDLIIPKSLLSMCLIKQGRTSLDARKILNRAVLKNLVEDYIDKGVECIKFNKQLWELNN